MPPRPDRFLARPASLAGAREPRVAWVVAAALLLALTLGASEALRPGPPDAVQPLEFNHRAHIRADIDCLQCHEGTLDPAAEPLPTLGTCVGCHRDPPGPHPEKAKLAGLAATGAPLAWDPLLRLPDHVFFSHARHVDVAELVCVDCHADMPFRTGPPKYRRTMGMEECISCHEESAAKHPVASRATLDCAECHR